MADVLGSGERSIWDRISNGSETALAGYLIKEHPQTAALVLSKVKPACAAKVMAQLPAPLRNGIMRRMLTFKPIVDATMKMIEQTIHEDFMINLARNAAADTHSRMADIVNKMERQSMEEVLDNLTQTRPKSAEILKSLLFTFDDIIHMTPRARTTLFDQVPHEKVILALKGTNGPLRNVVLSALTARARRLVEHELEGASLPRSGTCSTRVARSPTRRWRWRRAARSNSPRPTRMRPTSASAVPGRGRLRGSGPTDTSRRAGRRGAVGGRRSGRRDV